MEMRKTLAGVAIAGMLCGAGALWADERAPKGPAEDGTLPALVKIAGEGEMDSHAFQFLTELSDDIGARVTGSPADRKAEDWGAAKMKSIGLENVRTEKYTIWKGWTRGTAEAEVLTPVRHKLHVDAMGWTGSTAAGGVEGDVVEVNLYDLDNEIKNVSRLKGKVSLVDKAAAKRPG
jgi:carboxypeptidase Q